MELGGNRIINDAFEAKLKSKNNSSTHKLTPDSDMLMRNAYVKKKYSKQKYLDPTKFLPGGKEDLFAGFDPQQSMFPPPNACNGPILTISEGLVSTPTKTTASQQNNTDDLFHSGGGIDLLFSPSPPKKMPPASTVRSTIVPPSNSNRDNRVKQNPGASSGRDDDSDIESQQHTLDSDINSSLDVVARPLSTKVARPLSFNIKSDYAIGRPSLRYNCSDEDAVEFTGLKSNVVKNNENGGPLPRNSSSKPQHRRQRSKSQEPGRSNTRTNSSSVLSRGEAQNRKNEDRAAGDHNNNSNENTRGRDGMSRRRSSSRSRSRSRKPRRGRNHTKSPGPGDEEKRPNSMRRVKSSEGVGSCPTTTFIDRDGYPSTSSKPLETVPLSDAKREQEAGRGVRVRSKASQGDDAGSGDPSSDFGTIATFSGISNEIDGRAVTGSNSIKNRRPRRSQSERDIYEAKSESGSIPSDRISRHAKSLFGEASSTSGQINANDDPVRRRRKKPPTRSKSSDAIDFEGFSKKNSIRRANSKTEKRPSIRTSSPQRGRMELSQSADKSMLSPTVIHQYKQAEDYLPCAPKI